jgi:glutathione S-transferase
VVLRYLPSGGALAPAFLAFGDGVRAHPAVARWIGEALVEPKVLDDEE